MGGQAAGDQAAGDQAQRAFEGREDHGLEEAAASEVSPPSWNDGACYDVSFGVNRSRRYHAKMRAWYQGWHDLVLALNAVLGTAAFVALLGGKAGWLPQILTGVVAAGSAIDTVLGFAKKAKRHDDLCRSFTDLAARMILRPANAANHAWACAERLKIERDEPPVRRLVDLIAENEEARSRGVAERDLLPLSGPQRTLGYCFTFGLPRLERRLAQQQAGA